VNLSSSTPTYLTYTPSDDSWLATNNAGAQVAFWRYDAFGNLATGTPDSPFGYSGQYTDASTGLVNDRARFYESQTGSLTTRDPDFSSTDTAYTYASADPINRADPSGECVSLFNAVCVGGGPVSSTLSFRFDPGAAANATVNVGRGASFGLSDRIADLISPGASCTVAQNGTDQLIGAAATTVASLGAGTAVESEEVAGSAGGRLVVGGGRAFATEGLPGDLSLNVDFSADPNVVGDISSAPFKSGSFNSIYFEKVPFQAFTGGNAEALSEAARLLQPGGELAIETGPAAPVAEILQNLQELGFENIYKDEPSFLRIEATYKGGPK
jgi:RHS repeat-associated protein